MKAKLFLVMFISFLIILTTCKKDDNNEDTSPDTMSLAKVGNKYTTNLPWGGGQVNGEIISSDNGVIEIQVNYNRATTIVKGKVTENSLIDFVYSFGDENKPFTLVNFDAKAGDMYTFSFGNLQIVREVTEVNSVYYIPALGKDVTTICVVESIPYGLDITIGGKIIRTVFWYFSPIYGLVCIEVITDDGDYYEIILNSIEIG